MAHVVPGKTDLEIFALKIDPHLKISGVPELIGIVPTKTATNFRFNPQSNYLVFSDTVYGDGNLMTVKSQDEDYESRGDTAYVFDSGYPRHWDVWAGPKKAQLFSVQLSSNSDGKWTLGSDFNSLLRSTGHVIHFL